MRKVIISYEKISPVVLANIISKQVCLACCSYRDINEDFFEFEVCGWLPLSQVEIVQIENILARYK